MQAKDANPARSVHVGRRVFLGAIAVGLAGLGIDVRGVPGLRLVASAFSVDGFQIYTTSGVPLITAGEYRLRVDGLVRKPVTFGLADLLAMPAIRTVHDYHCVTGWSVPGVDWVGVPLRHLLDVVGPRLGADYLLFASADGSYTESLTEEQARQPDVLLAYMLHGRPLSPEQGYPIRLVVPEMYGFKGIKWVSRITLSAVLQEGYWERRGYATDAWLGPRSNYGKDFGPHGQR